MEESVSCWIITYGENHNLYLQGCVYNANNVFFIVILRYLSVPNSNFPGPFLRKLPLIQAGIDPFTVVGMGSGVSSAEQTRGAKHSSPLACGHRCLLDTDSRDENDSTLHYTQYCMYSSVISTCGLMRGSMLLWTVSQNCVGESEVRSNTQTTWWY